MDDIKQYFTDLTTMQYNQLNQLGDLYGDWNSKINVISRKDIDNLYSNHVLHSMAIAKYVQFNTGANILDAGTGGGFPGIPLAILFPQTQFMLVDSVGKKLTVVNEVAKAVGLTNVTTYHGRVEDLGGDYDFVVSRAVTRLDEMWQWVKNSISSTNNHEVPNGLLYLKGGDITAEVPNNCFIQQIPLDNLLINTTLLDKALVHLYKK